MGVLMIIYKVTNLINGKLYVGQTVRSIQVRWRQHCRSNQSAIGLAIKKYGKDNFKIELLASAVSLEALNTLEISAIAEFNSRAPHGYNVHMGGDNHAWTDELKAKFSESRKGNGNPRFGTKGKYKHTVESKELLRQSRLGKSSAVATPVLCLNNNITYPSMCVAAKELRVCPNKISSVCSGARKHTQGYTFKKVGS